MDYTREPAVTHGPAIDPIFQTSRLRGGEYPYFWSSTTHLDGPSDRQGVAAVYVAFGLGFGLDAVSAGNGRVSPTGRSRGGSPAQRSQERRSGRLSLWPWAAGGRDKNRQLCSPLGRARSTPRACGSFRPTSRRCLSPGAGRRDRGEGREWDPRPAVGGRRLAGPAGNVRGRFWGCRPPPCVAAPRQGWPRCLAKKAARSPESAYSAFSHYRHRGAVHPWGARQSFAQPAQAELRGFPRRGERRMPKRCSPDNR